MKNYKINIDKPKPTQEEILSGRNFDAVLQQYKAAPGKVIKKPFWQSAGFIGSVVAVAATVTIVALVMSGKGDQNTADPSGTVISDNTNVPQPANGSNNGTQVWTPTKRTVTPPLAGVNVPYQSYKVSAKWGGEISYPTGTKIKFSPNSFVDKNGAPVTGNVDVKYREMHDAVDFFLAGVPMQYDSAGQTWQLESAGMMEVAAFVNGEVVYLKKDKPMEVQMASFAGGSDYNMYYFDTVAGNWTYQGKDAVKEMPFDREQYLKDSLEALQMWLAQNRRGGNNGGPICGGVQHQPVDGVCPRKADPTKNRFVVDFNKEEFPEMASYQNVIFEVDESKEKFNPANYDVTWETVALSRGDAVSKYILTLKKGLKTLKLDVYPVLDGAEYDAQYAAYQKQHTQYLIDSANYRSQPSPLPNALPQVTPIVQNQQPQLSDAELAKQFRFDPEAFKRMKAEQASAQYAGDVQRTFMASGFGFYNCDRPEKVPQGAAVMLTINGPDRQLFAGNMVYHVDRELNSIMTCGNNTEFHFNPSSQNLCWAVMDGELYYAENESFVGLPLSGQATINLTKVPHKLNTPEEMRAFFHLKAPNAG